MNRGARHAGELKMGVVAGGPCVGSRESPYADVRGSLLDGQQPVVSAEVDL